MWVFSSYMVGDLFMALPALRKLAAAGNLRVICRPDCAGLLRREGFDPLPFDNAFFVRPGIGTFFASLRAAWRLRRIPVSAALDLDADPRSALWLRIAGASRIVSYARPYGVLFDEMFELPTTAIHQADKNMAVALEFLKTREFGAEPLHAETPSTEAPAEKTPWIVSAWTRKASKNWPFANWEEFLGRMRAANVPFVILRAPDGDAAYRDFEMRWRGRAEFVEGPLETIASRVKESAGVVATDNFLGHMAGYYEKPVLWLNVCSPAAQVTPRGLHTIAVGEGTPEKPRLPSVDEAWQAFLKLRG